MHVQPSKPRPCCSVAILVNKKISDAPPGNALTRIPGLITIVSI